MSYGSAAACRQGLTACTDTPQGLRCKLSTQFKLQWWMEDSKHTGDVNVDFVTIVQLWVLTQQLRRRLDQEAFLLTLDHCWSTQRGMVHFPSAWAGVVA